MEKTVRWWVEFLVQLESGKRIVAIFIVITIGLTYALIKTSAKLDALRMENNKSERMHGLNIARLKDSVAADKSRYMNFYNEKTENIYKEQLEKLNQVEKNAIKTYNKLTKKF